MKVFCPNCGTENDGTQGSRVTCRACTASFEVPIEQGQAPAPQAPTFGGQPVQSFDRPAAQPVQAPAPMVQPPPNVWSPNAPGSYSAPPAPGGQTNTLAIVSLVSGLVGCLCLPALGSLTGIITGFVALSQINAANGGQKGRELAIGGIVVSFLGCFGWLAYFVIAAISAS
ncbi:MAG: DUF4190 domain-containing protein [Myxococcus sp.]|nr:DUF4190 domain-containing protein [Myxococcus sp.]